MDSAAVPLPSTIAPVRSAFRALATTLLPETRDLDEGGWRRLETIVDGALAERPGSVRRQLRAFVRLTQLLPVLRYGRTFAALPAARRLAFLRALETAPVLLVRRGLWGVRTLVFMGYYGQEDVRRALGYRASAAGWEARTGTAPPRPRQHANAAAPELEDGGGG